MWLRFGIALMDDDVAALGHSAGDSTFLLRWGRCCALRDGAAESFVASLFHMHLWDMNATVAFVHVNSFVLAFGPGVTKSPPEQWTSHVAGAMRNSHAGLPAGQIKGPWGVKNTHTHTISTGMVQKQRSFDLKPGFESDDLWNQGRFHDP